jgi:hypothetical protein
MRIMIALTLFAVACSGPKSKPESPLVNEGSAPPPENCCCKSTPLTSGGVPIYEPNTNRMECSSKQGDCVDDVQCEKTQPPSTE